MPARYLSPRGELDKNTIVATVMSNGGLFSSLQNLGVNGEKTRVGDRFVYEKMLETGATLGGEPSGHIIFSRYATTGDGILTAIKLTEMAVENKCKFSLLFEGMESYPQAVVNVKVKNKTGALNSLAVAFAAADAEEYVYVPAGDGE